jgi:DNA topoisomerase VI subunit A
MAYDSENLTTPNIYWLGVRPSDVGNYHIPPSCIKSLSQRELKSVKSLITKPFMKNRPVWQEELDRMLITKEKIDIKAANNVGMKLLAETYLPAN